MTREIDETIWQIANELLTKKLGRYWYDGPGADFSIVIWGDDILIDGYTKEEEYEDSGVNLEVTLDNIEESED